jgi:pimeloyl-ACP methyl ester carboxylesterase
LDIGHSQADGDKQTGAPCVWVLGHSEGGLVALAAAQKLTEICGLVLVAAAGQPLGRVLREQLRANPANTLMLDQAMAAIDALEAGKRVDVTPAPWAYAAVRAANCKDTSSASSPTIPSSDRAGDRIKPRADLSKAARLLRRAKHRSQAC